MIITVRMPIARSSSNRARMPALTMSSSRTTPSTRVPSATTSGVAPRLATSSTALRTSRGSAPPTCLVIVSDAPLRIARSPTSMPLMRVCAENAMKVAPSGTSIAAPYLLLPSATIDLPSGVSSASDDRVAAFASSASVTPLAGMNAVAWRLPWVIVPVLSSRSTSTSPAASTARPEVASTLAWIIRSMPAMPIALSRPPIVVGIRHTSSATSTVKVTGCPAPC